jgi:pentatricopeptide repeat protein
MSVISLDSIKIITFLVVSNRLTLPLKEAWLPSGLLGNSDSKAKGEESRKLMESVVPEETHRLLSQYKSEVENLLQEQQLLSDSSRVSDLNETATSLATLQLPSSLLAQKSEMADRTNITLLKYAEANQLTEAMALYDTMKELALPVDRFILPSLISAATRAQSFAVADSLFTEALNDDSVDMNVEVWGAKIELLVSQKKVNDAIDLLDRLMKLKVTPTPTMYSDILGGLIRIRKLDAAYEFWERMHLEDVDIDHAGFHHMLNYCRIKKEAERSVFYLEEMGCYNLEPSVNTFKLFFDAVATAPHHVPGYQDSMFEAMCKMEGKELMPNSAIYDSIIGGFAKARDPVAAEYYFWEMQRKGIQPTETTYVRLLDAYAKAQIVGAKSYGKLGRYVKPPKKTPTPDERDMMQLGPDRVSQLSTYLRVSFGDYRV